MEKVNNLAESVLSSAYTAGDGVISLVDASGFDVGNRVRLGNDDRTLFHVTAKVSNDLTVEVEANDGDAGSGAGVFSVLTEGTLDGYRADALIVTPWSSRPSPRKPGLVQRYTDAPYVGIDDGAALSYWGPFPQLRRMVPPSTLSMVWRNQGSASIDETNGYTVFTVPQQSTNFRIREMNPPSSHYRLTMCLQTEDDGTGQRYFGPILHETSSVKSLSTLWRSVSLESRVYRLSSLSAHASEQCNVSIGNLLHTRLEMVWERIEVTPTTLNFYHSHNGYEWTLIYTEGLTSYFSTGPDKIGILGNIDNNNAAIKTRVYSFEVEDLT